MVQKLHRVTGKKSKSWMIWSTLQKRKKKGKEHDIHDEVVQKEHAIPDDV